MAQILASLVKELREKTNAGMMDCKNALSEADGNLAKAEQILKEKGRISAEKKSERIAKEGIVASYIHMQGKVGVLIEVNCETDFVAKNDNFKNFVKDLTLHIAASNPKFISRDEVSNKFYNNQDFDDKEEFLKSICLLEQNFIKNPDTNIDNLIKEKIAEIGENIVVKRFTRYALGE